MNFPLIQNLSLRARFRITLGIVLIPLIVVALGSGIFLQRAANALNKIVEQPVYKLQTTSRMQNVIRQAHASVKEYLNTGRYALRVQFESGAQAAEDIFIEILGKPFLSPQEYTLLTNVRHAWKESVATAMVIFAPNSPKMAAYTLDQRVHQILFALDQIQETYYGEIDTQRARVNKAESRFLLILVFTVGVGLIIAIIGAVLLTRSIVVPLLEFEKGLEHFANNDLSYRLNLTSQDELGRLAREFNTMAERLMTHQNKLQELSTRDGLTDLYNRREFDNRLREEALRARRYNKPFSVLMLDVDHFKHVNDRYGHPAGDEVLITVADLIRLNVRPIDAVCRYGGEEFSVILPETDKEGARVVAERIRSTLADSLTATPQGDMIRVTVSIGIAAFPRDGDTGPALINAADQALYAAKHEGRNLVRIHISSNL